MAQAPRRLPAPASPIDFSGGTTGPGPARVVRYPFPPGSTTGLPSSENVSAYRFRIETGPGLITGSGTTVRFDVSTLAGMPNPDDVRVFQRNLPGDGFYRTSPGSSYFTEVANVSYDAGSNELLATVDGFSEFVFTSTSNPLPVELAGLTATPTGSDIAIQWRTTRETGNRQFTIERSLSGEVASRDVALEEATSSSEADRWRAIGSVEGAGTTAQAQSYRFVDTGVPYAANQVEYRLRQIDTDGRETVSAPVTVRRAVRVPSFRGPSPTQREAQPRFGTRFQPESRCSLCCTMCSGAASGP